MKTTVIDVEDLMKPVRAAAADGPGREIEFSQQDPFLWQWSVFASPKNNSRNNDRTTLADLPMIDSVVLSVRIIKVSSSGDLDLHHFDCA